MSPSPCEQAQGQAVRDPPLNGWLLSGHHALSLWHKTAAQHTSCLKFAGKAITHGALSKELQHSTQPVSGNA